jgi:hypothetical protein
MSLIGATKKEIKKGETLPTACKDFLHDHTAPSVTGSSDRKWIYFENKMAANYSDKRRPSAATLL